MVVVPEVTAVPALVTPKRYVPVVPCVKLPTWDFEIVRSGAAFCVIFKQILPLIVPLSPAAVSAK
jgi:hypothetical protein